MVLRPYQFSKILAPAIMLFVLIVGYFSVAALAKGITPLPLSAVPPGYSSTKHLHAGNRDFDAYWGVGGNPGLHSAPASHFHRVMGWEQDIASTHDTSDPSFTEYTFVASRLWAGTPLEKNSQALALDMADTVTSWEWGFVSTTSAQLQTTPHSGQTFLIWNDTQDSEVFIIGALWYRKFEVEGIASGPLDNSADIQATFNQLLLLAMSYETTTSG